jgi:hypothetical protein
MCIRPLGKVFLLDTPREFSVDTAPVPTRYVLDVDHIAVSTQVADQMDLPIEFQLEDKQISVCRANVSEEARRRLAGHISPVYRLGERGALAVPTGRIFVRFAKGMALESRKQQIEAAGYIIQHTLSYAPHAGWLTIRTGQVGEMLAGFSRLREMAGLESAEPQMLMDSPASVRNCRIPRREDACRMEAEAAVASDSTGHSARTTFSCNPCPGWRAQRLFRFR